MRGNTLCLNDDHEYAVSILCVDSASPFGKKKDLCADGVAGSRVAANGVCFYSIAKQTCGPKLFGPSLMLGCVDWATEKEQQQLARLKETRVFAS